MAVFKFLLKNTLISNLLPIGHTACLEDTENGLIVKWHTVRIRTRICLKQTLCYTSFSLPSPLLWFWDQIFIHHLFTFPAQNVDRWSWTIHRWRWVRCMEKTKFVCSSSICWNQCGPVDQGRPPPTRPAAQACDLQPSGGSCPARRSNLSASSASAGDLLRTGNVNRRVPASRAEAPASSVN
jgi:hypothetical protein